MAGPLRTEYPAVSYHITTRDNQGEMVIFGK